MREKTTAPAVSITKCSTYGTDEVESAVGRAVELAGGMGRFVKKGERILLKPNLLSAKPSEKAVTTHPEVVRAIIGLVRRAGATPVVGDSPGLGSALKVARRCGVLDVCVQTNTPLADFMTLVIIEKLRCRT